MSGKLARFGLSVGLASLASCDNSDRDDGNMGQSSSAITAGGTEGGSDSSAASDSAPEDDNASSDGERLDVGSGESEGLDCNEGEDCPDECEAYEHTPCDNGTADPMNAMGIGCPGEPEVSFVASGNPQAIGVRTGFGPTDEWAPREGSSFAVLGTGLLSDLDIPTPTGDSDRDPANCDDQLGAEYMKGKDLPPPIQAINVTADCTEDPGRLGTGDCSNTIASQFSQSQAGAFDYTEVRLEAQVPVGQNSLSYDFAFFTVEYPFYSGRPFNDMYIGWLESENWTGNISFDESGNPISLNAGFLDFRDDGGTQVPEFEGTCMQRHAGTRWLNTTAPVVPGEQITLVLAIFDLQDANLDSYVFLDNWEWGCDGTDRPETTPVG